jgi:hypothetical protein
MGYLHINNLYKDQQILQFRRIYALEKIHGTSAHVRWSDGKLSFFSGGETHDRFVALFDQDNLTKAFTEKIGVDDRTVVVYGEAYGGKQQGMSATYGPNLRFVAFDVKVGPSWLQVEQAHGLCIGLGLEFVDYEQIEATVEEVDRCRDLPSTQAARNGITEKRIREGVVLRPPFEVTLNNGERLIVKHKRDEFRETKTPRVMDPEKMVVLQVAEAIADEWVTAERFKHVVDQLLRERDHKQVEMSDAGALIKLMYTDVLREAAGEIVFTKELSKAIGAVTVKLLKASMEQRLRGA